ncbi:ComF family protein [uncultured Salinisphaera sp.]|uniref:ComF family protein n=1 Tax=uncultured Salinisphaera sp. TaxID=359372 RepID=UPI0032B124D6
MAFSIIDNWSKNNLTAWLPRTCALCAARLIDDAGICRACRRDLPWLVRSCCHCALPLAADSAATLCSGCQRAPVFDHAYAACHYDEALAWLIGALKFRGRIQHARPLALLLAERLADNGWASCDVLLPVPLHPRQFRARGFNQAERIAHHLGRALGVPVVDDALQRRRATQRQSGLAASERRANVAGAFVATADLTGRHVGIVDDVITTTRTARAAADAAADAGALLITCLAPARA